jgi:hypothetical protein
METKTTTITTITATTTITTITATTTRTTTATVREHQQQLRRQKR